MNNANLTIVAIDDNQDALAALKSGVRKAFPRAAFFTAANGAAGIELALEKDPDVILLDVLMPGMNGFEVCGRLKADARLADTPVILMTILQAADNVYAKAAEAGAEAVLHKPLELGEVVVQIRAMAKIKAAVVFREREKERLKALVAERTGELERYIGERKRVETALQESEVKYRALFEQAGDYIILLEIPAKGAPIIRDANQAALKVHGYAREELVGKPVSILETDVSSEDTALRRAEMRKNGQSVFEVRHRRKNGTFFEAEASVREIRLGETVYAISCERDITERKSAEAKIKASLAEKEVLLKEIHHRVKNNLQVVSSLLNLQSRAIKDEAAQTALRESRARVNAMALVHETLYSARDFSNLDMSGYVGRLMRGIIHSFMGGAEVSFSSEICDCSLSVDTAVSLGLILNELVSNALKYAFADGRRGKLKIGLAKGTEGYLLSVEDDGPGLPADFDPLKAKSLGMQLVTTLAKQISGAVEVSSVKGTRIVVRFPA